MKLICFTLTKEIATRGAIKKKELQLPACMFTLSFRSIPELKARFPELGEHFRVTNMYDVDCNPIEVPRDVLLIEGKDKIMKEMADLLQQNSDMLAEIKAEQKEIEEKTTLLSQITSLKNELTKYKELIESEENLIE